MPFNASYTAPKAAGFTSMAPGKPSTLASAVSQAQGKGGDDAMCPECGQAMPEDAGDE
jgi:hypothetical protein